MPNVFNRATGENVKTTDFPEFNTTDFLVDPDLSAVKDIPRELWVFDGDTVRPMNADEKASYDASHMIPIKPPVVPEFDAQARVEALEARVTAIELKIGI